MTGDSAKMSVRADRAGALIAQHVHGTLVPGNPRELGLTIDGSRLPTCDAGGAAADPPRPMHDELRSYNNEILEAIRPWVPEYSRPATTPAGGSYGVAWSRTCRTSWPGWHGPASAWTPSAVRTGVLAAARRRRAAAWTPSRRRCGLARGSSSSPASSWCLTRRAPAESRPSHGPARHAGGGRPCGGDALQTHPEAAVVELVTVFGGRTARDHRAAAADDKDRDAGDRPAHVLEDDVRVPRGPWPGWPCRAS